MNQNYKSRVRISFKPTKKNINWLNSQQISNDAIINKLIKEARKAELKKNKNHPDSLSQEVKS